MRSSRIVARAYRAIPFACLGLFLLMPGADAQMADPDAEFRIADHACAYGLDIWGKIVVWRDSRRCSGCDIYGYDLEERREFEVAVGGDRSRAWCVTNGRIVAWKEQFQGSWSRIYAR